MNMARALTNQDLYLNHEVRHATNQNKFCLYQSILGSTNLTAKREASKLLSPTP